MNTATKISADLAAIQTAGNTANGDRILTMTDAATPYFWNGTKGRRATADEARQAGLA